MSVQLKLRRNLASSLASFVGAQGEVVVDTTNNRIVVQDGSTAGGFAAAKLSEVMNLAEGSAITGSLTLSASGVYRVVSTGVVVTLPSTPWVGRPAVFIKEWTGAALPAVTVSGSIDGSNATISLLPHQAATLVWSASASSWMRL